jgi:excisionase family DNA binding protein
MSQELLSVEQVAERLKLHVRTVRNYVRDQRLKAVRIGKQYRIAREDLEAMMGGPLVPTPREGVIRHRRVEVSSIVQVHAIGPEEAIRLTNLLGAAANDRPEPGEPLRVHTFYEEERALLRVIVVGSAPATARMLELVSARPEDWAA